MSTSSSPCKRRIEIQVGRDPGQTQLSLALSPVLTTGYYSESLSQSVSASDPVPKTSNMRRPIVSQNSGSTLCVSFFF